MNNDEHSYAHVHAFLFGVYLGAELLNYRYIYVATLVDNTKPFSKVVVSIYAPTSCVFPLLHIFANTWIIFFHFSHSSRCLVMSHCGLYLYFPNY